MYDDCKVKPLHKKLPKTSEYAKSFDKQTKWMYFLIEDDNLLEKIILFGINTVFLGRPSLRKIF